MSAKKGGAVQHIKLKQPLNPVEVKAPADVSRLLISTIEEVRNGTIHPRVANCIGYLSMQLLKAFEFTQTNAKLDEIRATLLRRQSERKKEYD